MAANQPREGDEGRRFAAFGHGERRLDRYHEAPGPLPLHEHGKEGRTRLPGERDRARWEPPGFAIDLNDDVSPGWPTECDDRDDFVRREPGTDAAIGPEFGCGGMLMWPANQRASTRTTSGLSHLRWYALSPKPWPGRVNC